MTHCGIHLNYAHSVETRILDRVPGFVLCFENKQVPNQPKNLEKQTQETRACDKQAQDLNTTPLYCSVELRSGGKFE